MPGFEDKITRFRWLDLDDKHATLRVWEDDEHARLVLFTEDHTGRTYVLSDQPIAESPDEGSSPASQGA